MVVQHVAGKDTFKATIDGDKLTVVDFFAVWCGPCKVISPKYEEFSNKYGDKATFLKVDVDEVADVAEMAGIRAMPTFHFYKKGQKVGEVVGADVKQLEEKIKTLSA